MVAVVQHVPEAVPEKLRTGLLTAYPELGEVEFIDRIPMDPRPQGKIDHEALRTVMER